MFKNKKKDDETDLQAGENKEILIDDLSKKKSKTKKDDASADSAQGSVVVPKSKVVLVKKLLFNIKENSEKLSNILSGFVNEEDEALIGLGQATDESFESSEEDESESNIIEGVFDGETMIGPDGKQYSVPANYASKSKLVEGDILKLTITSRGTFVYKQISPIERSRVIGKLEKTSEGNFYVIANNPSSAEASAGKKKWRVLTASVTYFKGESGDEAVILTPKTGESKWAAVENVVKKA